MKLTSLLVTGLFALPLVAATAHLLLSRFHHGKTVFQSGFIILWFVNVALLFWYIQKPLAIAVAHWQAPFGIVLVFDPLTTLMLLVFAILMVAINWYSYDDNTLQGKSSAFYLGFWLLALGLSGAVCTGDVFNLYVWLEVMMVASLLLLCTTTQLKAHAVVHYAIINIIGTLCLLLAISMLYAITGSLNYADIALFFQDHQTALALPIVGILFFALSVKGALFPLYFWLPKAYPNTSYTSTMLLGGISTKVIMIVMLRCWLLWSPHHGWLTILLLGVAWATMFFGVMGATGQFRFRDILVFHIISQLGYVVLAILIPGTLAIVAALYFLIHNIFVKTNLIMVSALIEKHFGTNDLKKLGQGLKKNKTLAAIFFVAAMSLAGIPPLSGFWAKFLVLKAAIVQGFYISAAIALVVSLFTLYSMLKLWRYVFCEPSSIPLKRGVDTLRLRRHSALAITLLFSITLIIGLWPDSLLNFLNGVQQQLISPTTYINTVFGANP